MRRSFGIVFRLVDPWCSGLAHPPVTRKIVGSNPIGSAFAVDSSLRQDKSANKNPPLLGDFLVKIGVVYSNIPSRLAS